jgi:hypothetical protein
MAFDNVGFFTLAPAGQVNSTTAAGVTFGGADRGAQYVGPHLIFGPGTVLVDQQRTVRHDDGKFDYNATFRNLENRFVSFTLTGGGFI